MSEPRGRANEHHGAEQYSDDELVAALAEHLEIAEPVPPGADTIIDTAFSFLTAEDELAALLSNSLVGADGMRGDSAAHTILYGFDDLEVEIHIEPGSPATGQIIPPGPVDVSLQHRHGGEIETTGLAADDVGRFLLPVDLALFRLRVERGGATAFWTPWTVL
jgi:hypothetical protein